MTFSREEVLHLANLSRLTLTEEEITKYQQELPSILEYVGKLSEVDTKNVAPMTGGGTFAAELRPDAPQPSSEATRQALINAFPAKAGDLLKVKTILPANRSTKTASTTHAGAAAHDAGDNQ